MRFFLRQSMQSVSLGRRFDHSLVGVVWQAGLRKTRLSQQLLVSGRRFGHCFVRVFLPSGLRTYCPFVWLVCLSFCPLAASDEPACGALGGRELVRRRAGQ